MAGVGLPARVALPVLRWRDALPHVVMAAVMAWTMLGDHSPLRDLGGIFALVATSMLCASRARADATYREHLVDLWAMALVLVACLPGHSAGGVHEHFSLPGGPTFLAVVLAFWLLARVVLWRRRTDSARGVFVSAGIVGVGLAAMVVLCAAR